MRCSILLDVNCGDNILLRCDIGPSRRDDIESLGYSLVALAKGMHPWTTTSSTTSRKQHNNATSSVKTKDISNAGDGAAGRSRGYLRKEMLLLRATTPITSLCRSLPGNHVTYTSTTPTIMLTSIRYTSLYCHTPANMHHERPYVAEHHAHTAETQLYATPLCGLY
jgi:hypothetical protein